MKFSLSWLKDYLDTDADVTAIADACTRIGLEVEGIENPAEKLTAFRIPHCQGAERRAASAGRQVAGALHRCR